VEVGSYAWMGRRREGEGRRERQQDTLFSFLMAMLACASVFHATYHMYMGFIPFMNFLISYKDKGDNLGTNYL
jgi:hypothetical protein